jgi:3-isopropylmalate/(R)-2-methylmalate dehydratase large subunit
VSDPDAHFDCEIQLDASAVVPQVTWGTSPEMIAGIDGRVPDPAQEDDPSRRRAVENALRYMWLVSGQRDHL